jgi:hypothetical protein
MNEYMAIGDFPQKQFKFYIHIERRFYDSGTRFSSPDTYVYEQCFL